MATAALGPYTLKDWLSTPEGEHWELIHGNLVMTGETAGNSKLARKILVALDNYLERHPLGEAAHNTAFGFPGIIDLDREGVVPDLCYIPNDQLSKWDDEANVQKGVIPALVVEILSPSTREIDLVDKVEIYREAGVSEYWILDRSQEAMRIWRFSENPNAPIAVQSFAETITTPLLPGFVLDLPKIRKTLVVGRKCPDQSR
ncbi:Uma2 family endonuclease [Methylacidimicrobium sp. B4]|uniref:Uma2 family endonuclease n=1 Tax=Methylacidimicrobium sp. B4 TaxID=2796139 RepID=UPI001A8C7CC4|nr:Uma2 family endonuclease [Methylacidimicrobium sp. B4]QSR84084.1 Uma2 family endonuclease [Methylacidimicrobium sp. B4]